MPATRWFLRICAVAGVAAVVALWCGWIVTEVGRQPWIVNGYMRTADAVTPAQGIWWVFGVTMALYAALGVIAITVLRGLSRRWREGAAEGRDFSHTDLRRASGRGHPYEQRRRLRGDPLDRGDALRDLRRSRLRRGGLGSAGGSGERAERVRAQIDRSIGPVWEANHVWLIFVLVVLWTAFSQAFSAIFSTLYIPLALAALGIVLRGSGFAFRHALPGPVERPASRVFGFASVLTPFFMGTVVGAVASGEVPAGGDGDPTASWTGFLPLVTGVLFVLLTSYTAAVFLVRDSGAAGDTELRDYFQRRALAAAVIAGAAAVVGVIALHADGRYVYDGLTSWPGIALVILSGICGLVALGLLISGRNFAPAGGGGGGRQRPSSGAYSRRLPYILPTSLKISDAAGASTTLTWVIVIFGVAAVTVIPSLVLL